MYKSLCCTNFFVEFEEKILQILIMSRRKQLRPFKVHDDENDTDQTSEIRSSKTQSTNGDNKDTATQLLGKPKHSVFILCQTFFYF